MSCALLLYGDDSVELQCADGARLLLSPCGTEFMYERPQSGGLPAQRGRHRTEFVTSSCREHVLQALSFRNTFSSRPFLPSSLVPSEEITTLLPEISEVAWPALEDDAGCVTRLEDGSVKVSSLEGHAHLYMTALQKEVTVRFLCQLSCAPCAPENTTHNKENTDPQTAKIKPSRNRSKYSSCVLHQKSPSCLTKHACLYTWLVQRFSVADCPQPFRHPMDLAFHFHREFTRHSDVTRPVVEEETATESKSLEIRTVSVLPRTLPLTCSAAHMHRWSSCKSSLEGEDALAGNPLPLKVVIYNDVLYRFLLDGSNLVEIHPGDGSVFISEGDYMGKYFKHCFIKEDSKQIDDRLYPVRGLPPDIPRAPYSVRALISRATRLLEFCCQHKLSINPDSCCWRTGSEPDSRAVVPVLLEQSFIPNQGRFAVYSNNAVYVSYMDGVLLQMIWGFAIFNKNEECPDGTALQKPSSVARPQERFGWCCLRFPNGSSKLLEVEDPGEYASYIRTAVAWCRWLDDKSLGEVMSPANTEAEMMKGFGTVAHELQKIQRFNFLSEHGSAQSHRNDIKLPIRPDNDDGGGDGIGELNIQAILEKTSKAIQDIDSLLSARK